MSTVNKVILIGRLGGDPETKVFDNGGQITSFSLATNESYTNKQTGEKVENTDWHSVKTSGKLAEICDMYLKKGSNVYVEGRIKYKEYEKDGKKQYFTEIQANNITFLSSNTQEVNNSNNYTQTENDDLPF